MGNLSSGLSKRTELLDALNQTERELSTATVMFHSALAERLGLNATDHKALDILFQTGAITAGELAELTALTTGAVTGVIDRLEQAGFVRREQDPNDRRRVIIRPILDVGEREIAPLFESLGRAITELASRYSDQELAVILDFTRQATLILREEAARLRARTAE